MKLKIKKIIVVLNFWRMLIPTFVYILDKSFQKKVSKDLERLNLSNKHIKINVFGLWYAILYVPVFRTILFFRMNNHKIAREISKIFLPNKSNLEISGDIEGGFTIYHGQSSVIHCTSAGKNFSVYQNVTVGRNKEHYTEDGKDKPIIGNNVSLYPGCVVAGGIYIGNNVEIAANSVVLKNVPDNCLVVGNPAHIIKKDGEKVDITL